jgi:hypothetical protein
MNNLLSSKNINMFVGLFSIIVVLWVVMYGIPGIFVSLFNTLLGNFILLGIVLASFMKSKTMGISLTALFIILYQFSHMKK